MSIYRCLVFDGVMKLARFQDAKNKALSKRFFHYVCPHPTTLTRTNELRYRRENDANVQLNSDNSYKRVK